jgi:hypothetical protein
LRVLNPSFSTVTSYIPGTRKGTAKFPFSLVTDLPHLVCCCVRDLNYRTGHGRTTRVRDNAERLCRQERQAQKTRRAERNTVFI